MFIVLVIVIKQNSSHCKSKWLLKQILSLNHPLCCDITLHNDLIDFEVLFQPSIHNAKMFFPS